MYFVPLEEFAWCWDAVQNILGGHQINHSIHVLVYIPARQIE